MRYAYETTYVWDESKGRKVQRRRCVGHFDPETGEVVPNGRRGRPSGPRVPAVDTNSATNADNADADLARIAARCGELALACDALAAEASRLAAELRALARGAS